VFLIAKFAINCLQDCISGGHHLQVDKANFSLNMGVLYGFVLFMQGEKRD